MIWFLLSWMVYGIVVGIIAKAIHPGEDPVGFLPTILIGILGSYAGGLISWLLGFGTLGSPSGILMGVLGAVIVLWLNRKYFAAKND
jgi:uncharacterized membrane protein YeaQ/YmgE (transglycosylase-associated protein family)